MDAWRWGGQIKEIVIICIAMNWQVAGDITYILHIVVEWFIVHYGTLGDRKIYTILGLICLFIQLLIFGPPCFNTGYLRSCESFGKWRHNKLPKGKAYGVNNGFDHIAVAGREPQLCQLMCISW